MSKNENIFNHNHLENAKNEQLIKNNISDNSNAEQNSNLDENYLLVSGLSKTYIGGYIGLACVSFALKKNEKLAIIAGFKGGKTTLLSMIAGLESVTDGEIYLDGKLLNNMPIKLREIGYLDKNLQLNKFTTVKNTICYPLKIRKVDNNIIESKYLEIVKKLNIENLSDTKVSKLTAYQKTLVAISRLAILDRKLYLIDDIFSNLTSSEQHKIACILNNLFADKTMIFAVNNKVIAEELMPNKVLLLGYSTNIGYGNIHDKEIFIKTATGAKIFYGGKVCQIPCLIVSKNIIINDKSYPLKKRLKSDTFERATLLVDLSKIVFNDSKECCICSKIEYINDDNIAYLDIDGRVATINIENRKYNDGDDIKFSFDLENCIIYDFDSERLIST